MADGTASALPPLVRRFFADTARGDCAQHYDAGFGEWRGGRALGEGAVRGRASSVQSDAQVALASAAAAIGRAAGVSPGAGETPAFVRAVELATDRVATADKALWEDALRIPPPDSATSLGMRVLLEALAKSKPGTLFSNRPLAEQVVRQAVFALRAARLKKLRAQLERFGGVDSDAAAPPAPLDSETLARLVSARLEAEDDTIRRACENPFVVGPMQARIAELEAALAACQTGSVGDVRAAANPFAAAAVDENPFTVADFDNEARALLATDLAAARELERRLVEDLPPPPSAAASPVALAAPPAVSPVAPSAAPPAFSPVAPSAAPPAAPPAAQPIRARRPRPPPPPRVPINERPPFRVRRV